MGLGLGEGVRAVGSHGVRGIAAESRRGKPVAGLDSQVVVGEDAGLAALWRRVDELSAELAPADRRAVRNVIADTVVSGWHPSDDDVTRLVAFAAGHISAADYLSAVTRAAHTRPC